MNNCIKYIFVLFLLNSISCRPDNKTNNKFDGTWVDISPLTILGEEKHEFKFENNSFWLKYYIYSDVAFSFCNLVSERFDYYEGNYFFDDDSLFLKGIFVKSTYPDSNRIEQELPDCKNSYGEPYRYSFKYELINDTLQLRVRENYHYGDNNFSERDSIGAKILNRITIFLKRKK